MQVEQEDQVLTYDSGPRGQQTLRWRRLCGGPGLTGEDRQVRHRGCQTGRRGEAVLLGQEGDRSVVPEETRPATEEQSRGSCSVPSGCLEASLRTCSWQREGRWWRMGSSSEWMGGQLGKRWTDTLLWGPARPSAQSPHPRISAQAVFPVPVSVSLAEGPKSRERESLTVPAQITRRPETARQGARVTATQ